MKIQIKHRLTGVVLYECDVPEDFPSGLATRYALEKATAIRPRIDLRGADLRGANLTGADLRGADLRGVDLMGADLMGANLTGADLRGADLMDANLTGANLTGADLMDANLTSANLMGVDLMGVDLMGADLTGVDLMGADDKQLPRATPEQAVENLDKVRAIILDNRSRLEMDYWHQNSDWKYRTCAEETLCHTTHCLAGWLQVCTTEPELKAVDPQLAGILAAPVAAKMFFRSGDAVLAWLENREYATA